MKALTISQPFASLIADGAKWVENRIWGTPYRGPLAIHAGKGSQYLGSEDLKKYPRGCVVAVGVLVGCERLALIRNLLVRAPRFVEDCEAMPDYWRERLGKTPHDILHHEHTEGPWCWILADVRKLAEPIPARGAQGLWDWVPPAGFLAMEATR